MQSKSTPRRRHSAELRAKVLAECKAPGASVAAVALAHGLNANLVHKWRRDLVSTRPVVVGNRRCDQKAADGFVALQVAVSPTSPPAADIRIELRRGATSVNIAWPVAAADGCAAWLRELLR